MIKAHHELLLILFYDLRPDVSNLISALMTPLLSREFLVELHLLLRSKSCGQFSPLFWWISPSSGLYSGDSSSFSPLLRPITNSTEDHPPIIRFPVFKNLRRTSFSFSVVAPSPFSHVFILPYFLIRDFRIRHLE
ncbi:hypothetical protein ACTXT7_006678 [Hymenolepis weldensis]